MKKLLYILLSVLLGCTFLVSAYTKTLPVEIFEFRLTDTGWIGWGIAPYLARFIIAIEVFLGILFFINIKYKARLVPIIGILLVSVFSIYLIYDLAKNGNSGNCGCFGEVISMTPLVSIAKNMITIIFMALLIRMGSPMMNRRFVNITFVAAIVITSLVFVKYPLVAMSSANTNRVGNQLDINKLYDTKQQYKPSIDLHNGKHIVVFLSLKCNHCKLTAKKLSIIHEQHPQLPIYILLNGKKENLSSFVKEHNIAKIPHNLFLGPEEWVSLAGVQLPVIYFVNNSTIEKEYDGDNLNSNDMLEWFNDKE